MIKEKRPKNFKKTHHYPIGRMRGNKRFLKKKGTYKKNEQGHEL